MTTSIHMPPSSVAQAALGTEPESDPPALSAGAALAAAFLRFEEGDAGSLLGLLGDDIVWEVHGTTPWSGTREGKAQVMNDLLLPLFACFTGPMVPRHVRMHGDGPVVVVQWEGDATLQSGAPYRNRYCWICTFEGGRVRGLEEYLDTDLASTLPLPPSRSGR
jgi:ketosteroid isomerase-like protein